MMYVSKRSCDTNTEFGPVFIWLMYVLLYNGLIYLTNHMTIAIWVVSIGRFAAFYFVLVPLEYVPTIPPHSTFVLFITWQAQ